MNNQTVQPTQSNSPRCLRCDKPVEGFVVTPHPTSSDLVTVEYHCHGESAEQELPASLLKGEQGLALYGAFNDYTSGLMPLKRVAQGGANE